MAPTPTLSPRPTRFPPALTVLVAAAVLYFARDVLIPIALAVLLTFLFAPLVRRLERHHVPRFLAVGAVVGFGVTVVGGVGWVLQGQVLEVASNLPQYKHNIRHKLEALKFDSGGVIDRASDAIAEIGREINGSKDAAEPMAAKPSEPTAVTIVDRPIPPLTYARSFLGPLFAQIATAGIVIVFTVFMLMKREDLRNRILWLIGERALHKSTPAFDDAAKRVSSYLMMQTVANGVAGLCMAVGLFLLGVPSAPLWGLLIALLRFIPYVGFIFGALLPFALSVATHPDWSQPAYVAILALSVEVVVGNLLEPVLYGSRTGLSPFAVLAAAVFWTWLWGPVGLVLATPLTVCLAVIGRHVPDLAFLEALLGDEPVLSPSAALYQRLLAADQEEAGRIIESFAKDKDVALVYDELFLPVLRLAEADRHRDAIDVDRHRAILDMVAIFVEDLAPAPAFDSERTSVLCVPARDRSDEIAGRMLAHLLSAAGVRAETVSTDSLASEIIQQALTDQPSVICVSCVPPAAGLHARIMRKRIRARLPEIPLLIGLWEDVEATDHTRARLGVTGPDFMVTTLRQAVEESRTLASTITRADSPVVVVPNIAAERTAASTDA